MKKRLIALFLILTMLFAACSDDDAKSNADSENDEATESAESQSNESSRGNENSDVSEDSNVSDEIHISDASDISDNSDISDTSSIPGDETSDEPTPPEPELDNPVNTKFNLLTGIEDLSEGAIGKRPVAVMVNNVSAAMPQYGIDEADIVFEMPVEGLQTRLMCIFADYTQLPKICSVRSCRKYFPAMSESFDAIYVNCGQNFSIDKYIDSLNLTQYDGRFYGTELFDRDKDRLNQGYAKEHTLYFNGPYFPTQLEKDEARTDLEEDKLGYAFNFYPIGITSAPTGEECKEIYIDFGSNESGFVYDSSTKTYKKTYYNRKTKTVIPHCDGKSGTQLEFANVFVLHNPVQYDSSAVYNAQGDMHRYIDWKGGKDSLGYYISNGVKQQIYWIKESENDKIKFFDLEGNELQINRGKSYICFNDMEDVDFE